MLPLSVKNPGPAVGPGFLLLHSCKGFPIDWNPSDGIMDRSNPKWPLFIAFADFQDGSGGTQLDP